jgi:hypothetical protein
VNKSAISLVRDAPKRRPGAANGGRLSDARAYAEAALANFRTFGDRAADDIQQIERIIGSIDQAIAKKARGA